MLSRLFCRERMMKPLSTSLMMLCDLTFMGLTIMLLQMVMTQFPDFTPATAGMAVSGTAAAMWVVLNSINQRKLKVLKMLVFAVKMGCWLRFGKQTSLVIFSTFIKFYP